MHNRPAQAALYEIITRNNRAVRRDRRINWIATTGGLAALIVGAATVAAAVTMTLLTGIGPL